MQGRSPENVEKRFWSKVDKTGDCWLWTGGACSLSIGSRSDGSRGMIAVNRLAWKLQYGEVPDGMCVLQSCRNKRCVHPDHLFLGSHQKALSRRDNSKLTGRPVRSMAERFWNKVEKGSDCWEWMAYKDKDGYGKIGYQNGGMLSAHRFSWILHFGSILDELFVLHHCDNPSCVRPDHLFLGTNQDNMNDMVKKGRSPKMRGERNGAAKLTDKIVKLVRRMHFEEGVPQKHLAKRFNVSTAAMSLAIRGLSWKGLR